MLKRLLFLPVLLCPPPLAAAGYEGFALNVEAGLATYGLSAVPTAFAAALEAGWRFEELALTIGYAAEPFADLGGSQGPRLKCYYYTNPAGQLALRLGGGVNWFWRLAPFRRSGQADEPLVRNLWSGELGIWLGVKLWGGLDAALDAGLLFPLGERVGLTLRLFFGLSYQL